MGDDKRDEAAEWTLVIGLQLVFTTLTKILFLSGETRVTEKGRSKFRFPRFSFNFKGYKRRGRTRRRLVKVSTERNGRWSAQSDVSQPLEGLDLCSPDLWTGLNLRLGPFVRGFMIPFAGIMEQQPGLSTAGDFLLSSAFKEDSPISPFPRSPLLRRLPGPRDKPIEPMMIKLDDSRHAVG